MAQTRIDFSQLILVRKIEESPPQNSNRQLKFGINPNWYFVSTACL